MDMEAEGIRHRCVPQLVVDEQHLVGRKTNQSGRVMENRLVRFGNAYTVRVNHIVKQMKSAKLGQATFQLGPGIGECAHRKAGLERCDLSGQFHVEAHDSLDPGLQISPAGLG